MDIKNFSEKIDSSIILPLNPLAVKLGISDADLKNNGIYIKGNVPSKKNSKTWTGRHLISSKPCKNYEKQTFYVFKSLKNIFRSIPYTPPLLLGIYLIRDTKRKFDYNNISQIILDMLTTTNCIDDDNASLLIPVFLGYTVNKKNAGVILLPLR